MTRRSTGPLSFPRPGSRRIEADLSGGSLAPDAGALLLRQADKRPGLPGASGAVTPDPRNQELIRHPQRCLLARRIFGIALGYEGLSDHPALRGDPFWQAPAERAPDPEKPLASAPALCRLESRTPRRAPFGTPRVLVERLVNSFEEPPECPVLDFGATDGPAHGEQVVTS
jgi:hypothetical protein